MINKNEKRRVNYILQIKKKNIEKNNFNFRLYKLLHASYLIKKKMKEEV
jgi:hypothetical protein